MRPSPVRIAPSILNADFSRLGEAVRMIERGGGAQVHVDVMDGHFVPNLSMGPQVVRSLKARTRLPMDVHLMVEAPEGLLPAFLDAGADSVTLHLESTGPLRRMLGAIRRAGRRAAVAIRPRTPLSRLWRLLPHVDMALLMTVEPGFGGQPFRRDMLPRLRAVRARAPGLDLQVDGGVTAATAADAVSAGANVLVAGVAIFGARDPVAALRGLKRLALAAAAAVLLALVLLAAPVTWAADFDTYVAQGKDAISLKQYKEAERLFKKALEIDPLHPEALYGAGYCAMQLNKPKTAIADFESVLKRTYTTPEQKGFHTLALTRIGEILLGHKEYAQAVDVYAQGVKNEPENAELRFGYGTALRGRGQNEKALAQFEAALKIDPKHAGAMVGKASIYYELGNVPEAFRLLTEASTQAPTSPLPYGVMAAFYQDLKKPFEQHLLLGHYYFYSSDPRRAAGEYRTALAIQETAEVHHTLGVAELQMDQAADAEQQFEKAIKMGIKPEDVAWAQLSMAQAKQGRVNQALVSLRKAIRLNDKMASYYGQLSWLSLKAGDVAGAESAAHTSLDLDANQSVAYRYLGDAYNTKGRAKEAIDAYEKCLSRDPTLSDVYVNLGWAYEQTGDFVSAQRNYETFLKMDSDPAVGKKVRAQIEDLKKRGRKKSP